jgi:folate-binding protein YgfZ
MSSTVSSSHARVAPSAPGTRSISPEELRTQLAAFQAGCGVYDLGSRVKIVLTGSDRVRWLNGMVTNNIRDLAVRHGVYAFLLNPQGHILADLYAYNRGDSLLVDTEQAEGEKVLGVFDHFIIMDDVEVANVSDKLTAIGVSGPKSTEILGNIGLAVPSLSPLQFVDVAWREVGLTLVCGETVRGENERRESYEIWLAPGNVDAIRSALIQAGATPVASEALELNRIAQGIPRYGQDIRERDLPQETGQSRALHFGKGCYIGQEIVERIRSRGAVHRKFTGLLIEGPLPAPGTKIQLDGKDVGEVTSVASLPGANGDHRVALGYVRKEFASPGKVLQAGESRATVAELPFPGTF